VDAPKRLFLVDGSALAYRSFFAFIRNPLLNSRGENTSAVFGFTTALLRILEQEHPDFLLVVFDTPQPTFRHERFAAYKATREKMPDEMAGQLPWVREVVEAFGVPIVERPGFEADDVIGTIATRAAAHGLEVRLVSGDKDLLQLVDARVHLWNPGRSGSGVEVSGPDEVRAKFGVPPEHVVDVLALMGDASDNVPGVPGIGEKTATKLVVEFGGLDAIYARLDEVTPPRVREKLREHREQAYLSRDLVTLDREVPLGGELDAFLVAPRPDAAQLAELYRKLEFRSLLEPLEANVESDEHAYRIVRTPHELEELFEGLAGASEVVVDLETTSLDALVARIVGFSFSLAEREAFYVPTNVVPPVADGPGGPDRALVERLRPILENPSIAKIGQNIQYDALVLLGYGVTLAGIAFDTMVASYCVEPGVRQHNLDALALRYLNFRKIPTADLLGKGAGDGITMADLPVERVGEYACEDADITLRLKSILELRMRELEVEALFRSIEIPLIPVLVGMEAAGVRLDTALLETMGASLAGRIESLEREIHDLAGAPFNLNSPQQLGAVLFERLEIQREFGVKRLRKTKTGYATDQQTLERYASHPIVSRILEYRQLAKLKSTYLDALPALVHPKTGRLHTSFNQTVAATGRLSSSNPNLQNIPIRTEIGREMRKAFIPEDDRHLFLGADYSQIELRILAHVTEDPALLEAFQRGEDIHARTAALVFGVHPSLVTSEMRGRAKAINFGVIYGMGPDRLAAEVKIPRSEAQAFIQAYFAKFARVREWIEHTVEGARASGYVTTLMGRRRILPEIGSNDARVRRNAENMAVNTPIQGSAADLIKKAMVEIHRTLAERGLGARMILQVHDELLLEVPEEEIDEATEIVRSRMEGAMTLRVPLVVDLRPGRSWYEVH